MKTTDTRTAAQLATQLRACTTIAQAEVIADTVKGKLLAELAAEVNAGTRRGRVADIRASIVTCTIRARLNTAAILDSIHTRPSHNMTDADRIARSCADLAASIRRTTASLTDGTPIDSATAKLLADAAQALTAAAMVRIWPQR